MELIEADFLKMRQERIAERIYDFKEEKKDLELQLSDEEFHYRYIPKRKELIRTEVFFRLLCIVPITIAAISTMKNLFWMFLGVFLIIFDIRLIIREIQMLYLLFISIDIPCIVEFAKEHDLNTFQKEQYKSKQKISYLQEKIANIEEKIIELETKKQIILEEKRQEAILYEEQNLIAEDSANSEKSSKFVLKKEAVGSWDERARYEYYLKEEQYLNMRMIQLNGKLQYMDKEIIKIEEDFHTARKNIIIYFVILLLLMLIQNFFKGELYEITAIICFTVMLLGSFYLEKICKQPILLYFVEHDSNLTKEYAFCNSMIPIQNKRKDLLEEIENNKKELLELKKRKESGIFS